MPSTISHGHSRVVSFEVINISDDDLDVQAAKSKKAQGKAPSHTKTSLLRHALPPNVEVHGDASDTGRLTRADLEAFELRFNHDDDIDVKPSGRGVGKLDHIPQHEEKEDDEGSQWLSIQQSKKKGD